VPHLLHLDSSADDRASVSRVLTGVFADAWQARGADFTVTYRDLRVDGPAHLTDAGLHWAPHLREIARAGAPQPVAADLAQQDALLAELTGADVLLVGAPLYNWSMPSSLKAWIDQIHVLGVTTPFGDDPFGRNAQPMLGRPAVIVTTSGDGGYGPGGANDGKNHGVPPLELVLGTALGMTVTVVSAEFTLAPILEVLAEQRPVAQANLDAARAQLTTLASQLT
jgi:FMN-dependent NADH-azoreductase